MPVSFALDQVHRIVSANTHYYEKPTEPLYLDRTLRFHDFIFLVNGSWTITEGETDYLLRDGDVLLLAAGHHHYTRLPCEAGTRTYCIHITEADGDSEEHQNSVTLPVCIHAPASSEIQSLFKRIVSTFWSDSSHKEEKGTALFNLLLIALEEAAQSGPVQSATLGRDIIRFLDSVPHLNFRVEEAANRFGVSMQELENAMISETGLSFSKFQASRKLEMAARQLEVEPGLKLAEVAANFGFCDEFHLSKAFKRQFGMPPSQYRKLCAQNQDRQGNREDTQHQ